MNVVTPLTALVVESNYLVASVIEAPLLEHGYIVSIAHDAEAARQFLAERHVDLALIDFRLQHGGPDGLVAALNARGVPFIVCTAASAEEVTEVFPEAVVAAKPFSDAQLWSIVESVVHRQAPVEQLPAA